MEERDGKNKFWNGVLVGALVTAFCGLIVVGGAAGIWIVARGASLGQIQTANEADSESGTGLNMTKIGRKLDAMMITADKDTLLILSGTGEVIEPDEGICAIGSGGNYALAAARALAQNTDYSAEEIARKSLKIASEICVYTNDHIICETV